MKASTVSPVKSVSSEEEPRRKRAAKRALMMDNDTPPPCQPQPAPTTPTPPATPELDVAKLEPLPAPIIRTPLQEAKYRLTLGQVQERVLERQEEKQVRT